MKALKTEYLNIILLLRFSKWQVHPIIGCEENGLKLRQAEEIINCKPPNNIIASVVHVRITNKPK